jgi:iron complex outermembrane receptor protein
MHGRYSHCRNLALAMASFSAQAAAQTVTLSHQAAPPAQNAAEGKSAAIEQIVVTANKRKEFQRAVANSVTALSGKELDRLRDVRLQDLAAQVPGLSLEADDKTAVRIVLRGLNTGSAGSTVASLLDDVPTSADNANVNAAINSPNFDTYDLQRIEVLRGPQSTLYGATAEGGLVKYVTNPPDPTTFKGGLETSIDGEPDGGLGGSLKGFINIPFGDGKAALRLTGWNDWIPGDIDNQQAGKTDTNSAQQYGWRASLIVLPVPELTIRLTAQRQSLFSNNADYVDVVGAAANPAAPPANQLSLARGLRNSTYFSQPSQNEAAIYSINADYDFDAAHLTSITAYTYGKYGSFFDASNSNVAPGTPIGAYLGTAAYGVPLAVDERQNSNTDKFSQELRLASDPGQTLFGRALDWIGGAYYTHESSAYLQFLDARPLQQLDTVLLPPTGGATSYSALSEWAVFAQADYHIVPAFDVELGGRWSGTAQHSDAGFACCLLYGPASNLGEISSNDHDALYSVAPRWRPTDDTMVYARVATGYRPGGPNTPVPGASVPLSYGPDHTTNYEIGLRQDLLQKSVTVDVTGFYINWRDVQILSLVNTPAGPVGVNGNAGAAVSKGVEWSLAWVPFSGLTLSAVGAYTDARLTVDAPGLGGLAGEFLPYVPNISNSVNAEYDWAPRDGYRAFVSATWSYTGQRYTGFAPAGGVTESHTGLPNYSTGALRLGLEHGALSGEIYINNISNSRALTYYTNQGGFDQTGQASIIQPRTIGLVTRIGF